jgi:hypothetical protein
LLSVWLDDSEIPAADIAWTPGSGASDGTGTGNVSTAAWLGQGSATAVELFWYLGDPLQPSPGELDTAFAEWNSGMKLSGITHLVAKFILDVDTEKVWQTGVPTNIKALLKGRLIFDRRQYALNADPTFTTPALGGPGCGARWFADAAQSTIVNAEWSFAAGVASLNEDHQRQLISERVPLDTAKLYTVQIDAQQTSGTMTQHLGVAFYDSAGAEITSATSDATGWASIGTHHYHHANTVFAATWTTYTTTFGAGGTATIPTGAVEMAVVIIGNEGGTPATTAIDIRDASFFEGSARHDYDTLSTWEWTDNPALWVAHYLTDVMGVPTTRLRWDTFNAAANHCDELVEIPPAASPSNTEKRFTCNGGISLGNTHRQNLLDLTSSMDGLLFYSGGTWGLKASKYEAPVLTITADDLAGQIVYRGSAQKSERYNTVRGVFTDPERNHQQVEFPHVSAAAYVTRDNGETLYRDLALPFTNKTTEAERIAARLLHRGNRQQLMEIPLNLSGVQHEIGDFVSVDIPELDWTDGENIILRSEDLTTTWTDIGTPVLVAGAAPSPFGSPNAVSIEDDNAAAFEGRSQQITVPNDSDSYIVSVYLKKQQAGGVIPGINVGLSGGSAVDINWRINPVTGEQVASDRPTWCESVGGYWRIATRITNNASGNVTLTISAYAATRTSLLAGDDNTLTGTAIFWGFQVERAAEPSQYKATGAVAVTTAPFIGRVESWEQEPAGTIKLTLREAASTDYDDLLVSDYGTVSTAGITVPGDVVPAPSALAAVAAVNAIVLTWTNPAEATFDFIQVWESPDSNWTNAVLIAEVDANTYTAAHMAGETYYYWVRAVRAPDLQSLRQPNTGTSTVTATALAVESVQLAGAALADVSATPTDAEVSYRISTTGAEQSYEGTGGSHADIADYLLLGAVADYECFMEDLATGTSVPTGSAVDTWLACTSDRTWTLTDTASGGGALTFNGTIKIRNATTQAILATASVTMSVEEIAGSVAVSANVADVWYATVTQTCYAGVQFNSSGEEFKNNSASSQTFGISRGNWLDAGASSAVWIERTVNTGALNWKDPGSGRLVLSTTREYGVTEITEFDFQACNVTFDFYDAASGGTLLDSVTLDLTAEYNL